MTPPITSDSAQELLARLPPVRGRLTPMAPLAPYTWFRVGGPAEVFFTPADPEDLAELLAGTPEEIPLTILGVGSNLLVRDGGIRGVAIRLGRGFNAVEPLEGGRLKAGAAALDSRAAEAAAEAGLGGLEYLRGVPGTIGGALRMNAGCYGTETKDRLISAEFLLRDGTRREVSAAGMEFGYRTARGWPEEGAVALSAIFQGEPDAPEAVRARMKELVARREASQPVKARTGGSTFRNPAGRSTADGSHMPLAAWRLIDEAGARGLRIGGAEVSPQHCNFLIAHEGAAAADVEALGEEVRRRVYETSGHELRWEIKRLGQPAPGVEPILDGVEAARERRAYGISSPEVAGASVNLSAEASGGDSTPFPPKAGEPEDRA